MQDKQTYVINCKITEVTTESRTVRCVSDKEEFVGQFKNNEWPKDWEDTKNFNDTVKIILDGKRILPVKSCAVRYEEQKRIYAQRGMGQLQMPLQLSVERDCEIDNK